MIAEEGITAVEAAFLGDEVTVTEVVGLGEGIEAFAIEEVGIGSVCRVFR